MAILRITYTEIMHRTKRKRKTRKKEKKVTSNFILALDHEFVI